MESVINYEAKASRQYFSNAPCNLITCETNWVWLRCMTRLCRSLQKEPSERGGKQAKLKPGFGHLIQYRREPVQLVSSTGLLDNNKRTEVSAWVGTLGAQKRVQFRTYCLVLSSPYNAIIIVKSIVKLRLDHLSAGPSIEADSYYSVSKGAKSFPSPSCA